MSSYSGEMILLLIDLILVIFVLPIILGVFFAVLTGAIGIYYYAIIILTILITWLIAGLIFWRE